MSENPSPTEPEAKPTEPEVKRVWTPPEGGGTTEPTKHPLGVLDSEEEALNKRSSSG